LIENKANVNLQQEKGRQSTPLHGAAYGGHYDVCKILLEALADISVKNRNNHVPCDDASTPEVKKLFESGGNQRKSASTPIISELVKRGSVLVLPPIPQFNSANLKLSRYVTVTALEEQISALAPHIMLDKEPPLTLFESVKLGFGAKFETGMYQLLNNYGMEQFRKFPITKCSQDEYLSIYFYTCEWGRHNLYALLNADLTHKDRNKAKSWRHYLHYVLGGLRKLPYWEGKQDLYRGVNLNLVEKYQHRYKEGEIITWYSFTSTTTLLHEVINFLPKNGRSTIFTINGVFSGRQIHQLSSIPKEEEVLIPPASRFKIKGIIDMGNHTTIQMEQVESLEQILKMELKKAEK